MHLLIYAKHSKLSPPVGFFNSTTKHVQHCYQKTEVLILIFYCGWQSVSDLIYLFRQRVYYSPTRHPSPHPFPSQTQELTLDATTQQTGKQTASWQNGTVSKFIPVEVNQVQQKTNSDTILRTNSQPCQDVRVNLPVKTKHSSQFADKQGQSTSNFLLHTEASL